MIITKRSNTGISARVAHAYFKYGRFCSSHPTSTILCSILSVLFLSYPLTRLRLPSSAPFDTVLADNVSEFLDSNEDDPSWLQGDAEPVAYIQQIFIRSKVEPWDPGDLTVKDAIKGPMIRAFEIHELLTNFVTKDNLGLDNFCFHVVQVNFADLRNKKPFTVFLKVKPKKTLPFRDVCTASIVFVLACFSEGTFVHL